MVLLWGDQTLHPVKIARLKEEFPFLDVETQPLDELLLENLSLCQEVDIIYADQLSLKQFEAFSCVKWVHSPQTDLKGFYYLINKREDVLFTHNIIKPSLHYIDFATTLLFASCQGVLFKKEIEASLKPFSKTLLVQIGLGVGGTAITQRAKEAHMRVIGVADHASFHPFCDKVLEEKQLHSVLPAADVVVVMAGRADEKPMALGQEEFALMKPGSTLFILGESQNIDFAALFAALDRGALSQVWFDFVWGETDPEKTWGWALFPCFFQTPGLIHSINSDPEAEFQFFLWNLDCFYHERYLEMKGLCSRAPARGLERRKLRNL